MFTIDEEITVADIDEAIAHIRTLMEDRYGNRLTHHKRTLLMDSIDDLLDARLNLTVK